MQNGKGLAATPVGLALSFWRSRELIKALARREVLGRYQGSLLGMLWSFFNPLFMLLVYTFVFSVIFKARWGGGGNDESRAMFALVLFAGMLVFNLFAECINRAPALILSNPTFVKKVVFPLEILPWVSFGAALFHAAINLLVWLLFSLFILGTPPVTALLFPLLLLPFTLFIMGLSWFLASLGVYLRDVSQIIGILTTALMFLTPIFYPVTNIPEGYRRIIYLNPLTFVVDQTRALLIFGQGVDWVGLGLFSLLSIVVAQSGFLWFQKTRKGFGDVL